MIYILVVIMTFVGSCGAYFFKKSADRADSVIGLFRTPVFYLGGTLYVVSALMNVVLLRYMDYTVLYPMTALTYIWSLLISKKFLGERITEKKVFGIISICIGVVLLTR